MLLSIGYLENTYRMAYTYKNPVLKEMSRLAAPPGREEARRRRLDGGGA